jgi:hypothetical protein
MSYLFAFLIALATKYAAVFLVQILIRQYVWENWVKVYFAWAKFLHRMNLLLLMRFWIDRVCFLSITPRLGLPFLSPKCFLEKRWRVLTSEIISGCLVLKLWGTRKITLIAMRMNGNSVLIFFLYILHYEAEYYWEAVAHGVKKCFVVEATFSYTCPQELASRRYPKSDLSANYIIFL